MPGNTQKAVRRLKNTPNQRKPAITPGDFEQTANTTGELSRVLRFRPNTPHAIRGGKHNPFYFALPAYESFNSDTTADNAETFTLSHSVVDTPNTQAVLVWLDGTRYGKPDSVDYGTNEITVTDSDATTSTVHVYYISDAPAEVSIEKRVAGANSATAQLWSGVVPSLHNADQSKGQPPHFRFGTDVLERFIAADMTLDVKVKAPYTVKFREDTDGTQADNALFNIPANEAQDTVPGLKQAIKASMSRA